ncbi:DUF3391 domain-containing protein [uncultured Erwinia sp.]|uniref:DUF3391 domain-containing protein n=1 Tax=uncultured Erwinia sp. TaxID=246798 RepID=UPI002590800F|nr:DUF3391 domain-containing protein [uncultured Erwinia sp.]
MIVGIAVNELRLGMYLYKLDVFWLKHPLVGNEMLLTDETQIKVIQNSGVREVWIDLSRGRGVEVKTGIVENVVLPEARHRLAISRRKLIAASPSPCAGRWRRRRKSAWRRKGP